MRSPLKECNKHEQRVRRYVFALCVARAGNMLQHGMFEKQLKPKRFKYLNRGRHHAMEEERQSEVEG